MNKIAKSIGSATVAAAAFLLFSASANALLPTHDCGNCHSLHGADTGLVPRTDQISMEVLCLGCHLTANGSTAAVQPHRSATRAGYPQMYSSCTDCHEVHDNMPNWRLNDPSHASDDDTKGRDGTDVRPGGWPVGVNTKMVGREDPDGETPYAIIFTKEADYNKDGVPDRNAAVTTTCDENIINDCYVTRKRHIIFENRDASDSTVTIHAWADGNEDGMQPSDAAAWGETIPDLGETNAGAPQDAICHVCHTFTSKNACGYDGSANCVIHNPQRTCTDCHTHDGCFNRDGCDVWTLPNRDVRMDTVSASPGSANSGQTVNITADFTNLGDATEVVRVKFYSSIDRYLGTIDVTDVAPGGGTGQAVFNWVTTTGGTHTVSAEAQPVLAEINVANNTATGNDVTVASVATHDIAVTSVVAPAVTQQGDTALVTVNLLNEGAFTESGYNVTLSSDRDGVIGTIGAPSLDPANSTGVGFSWDTTGATLGTHILTGSINIVDDDASDNSATTTADVIAATHDVAVDSVTAPATVAQGDTVTVSVAISNQGTFDETFNVTLVSDLDGTIQTLSSGLLGSGASTTLDFSWNSTGATTGTHTLTATADTVSGETDTADNSASTTADVVAPVHDVAVDSVTAPASTPQGDTVTVSVAISNQGTFDETFNVTLVSDLDGTIQTLSSGLLGAGGSTTLDFSWNTTGAPIGTHTLTATADTVTGETDTADNSASTTADVVSAATVHDVAVTLVSAPASFNRPNQGTATITVSVTVENQGDVEETFDVTLDSGELNTGDLPQTLPVTLGAGGSTVLNFTWTVAKSTTTRAVHTLTATAATVSGETDTADNSAATTIDIT